MQFRENLYHILTVVHLGPDVIFNLFIPFSQMKERLLTIPLFWCLLCIFNGSIFNMKSHPGSVAARAHVRTEQTRPNVLTLITL